MALTFSEAKQAFKNDEIQMLTDDLDGIKFLKIRSLSRKAYLERLYNEVEVSAKSDRKKDIFKALFDSSFSQEKIDQVIRDIYNEKRQKRRKAEEDLINQLYKVQSFGWGGLYQNSLERYIVNNIVKKIKKYDDLIFKIENDLHRSMREYTLASWYNHWTSIIIEDIFRDHDRILPAVGRIKKIDFFLDNVPFDLKVTYLPEGYIKNKRRDEDKTYELTLLKRCARNIGVSYDDDLSPNLLKEDLWRKLEDHPRTEAQLLISDLRKFRLGLLKELKNDPTPLIVWLYENQGIRRFDASNRLFLILVDEDDFFESWKLKRAKPLLDSTIHDHIDGMKVGHGRQITFNWKGATHQCLSDLILVTKPGETQ